MVLLVFLFVMFWKKILVILWYNGFLYKLYDFESEKKCWWNFENRYNDSNCFVYIVRKNLEFRVFRVFVIFVYIDDFFNDLICNFSKGVREFW